MTEFDHPIPEMETIADVLDYIRSRAEALGEGKWVVVRQVFITRLKEQRYPDAGGAGPGRAEEPRPLLDRPRRLGQHAGAEAQRHRQGLQGPRGRARSRRTRRPASRPASSATSRGTSRSTSSERKPTEQDQDRRLLELFQRLQLGRDHRRHRPQRQPTSAIDRYRRLHEAGELTVRVGDLAARRHLGPARGDPGRDPHGRPSTRCARAGRCSGSSASRRSSTAACSPAAPTCASPGA